MPVLIKCDILATSSQVIQIKTGLNLSKNKCENRNQHCV